MGVGKLKEPDRGESVGFNLLVFIASSALAYTSGGLLPIGAAVGWKSIGFNLYTIDEKNFPLAVEILF